MSNRKLSRAERRRQLRDERKEPEPFLSGDPDPEQMPLVAYSVGRMEGFMDGYIIGTVGVETYQSDAVQEMISAFPESHCEDEECYACRLAMEALGYCIGAESEEDAYSVGREAILNPKPLPQFAEWQQPNDPTRLRMTP